jgi:hypothetical protein
MTPGWSLLQPLLRDAFGLRALIVIEDVSFTPTGTGGFANTRSAMYIASYIDFHALLWLVPSTAFNTAFLSPGIFSTLRVWHRKRQDKDPDLLCQFLLNANPSELEDTAQGFVLAEFYCPFFAETQQEACLDIQVIYFNMMDTFWRILANNSLQEQYHSAHVFRVLEIFFSPLLLWVDSQQGTEVLFGLRSAQPIPGCLRAV